MYNSIKTAFPLSKETGVRKFKDGSLSFESGLTKREYFAALAMQGLCANDLVYTSLTQLQISHEAVSLADQVLKQLEK